MLRSIVGGIHRFSAEVLGNRRRENYLQFITDSGVVDGRRALRIWENLSSR